MESNSTLEWRFFLPLFLFFGFFFLSLKYVFSLRDSFIFSFQLSEVLKKKKNPSGCFETMGNSFHQFQIELNRDETALKSAKRENYNRMVVLYNHSLTKGKNFNSLESTDSSADRFMAAVH